MFAISGSYNSADMRYSIMNDNQGTGFEFSCSTNNTEKDSLNVSNSGFFRNNSYGLYTSCQAMFEHLTVLDNTNNGLRVHGSFHGMSQILSSSILWGNAANQSWDQIDVSSNFLNIAHTNLMGGSEGLTGSSWDLDESFISDLPYFEDEFGHMEPISPGVDGGKPWKLTPTCPWDWVAFVPTWACVGGPNNQYWGEASSLTEALLDGVVDIPQDQGNMLT